MKRVLIVGCGGAGKTTFAKNLSKITKLPVIHLDQHYWQPGWVETEKSVFLSDVSRLAEAEKWILDGNYKSSLPERLCRADTVFFLNVNRWQCLWHVFNRIRKSHGQVRDDMASGCPEQIDLGFARYIWNFPQKHRPILVALLEGFDGKLVCLKSFTEIDDYLVSLKID